MDYKTLDDVTLNGWIRDLSFWLNQERDPLWYTKKQFYKHLPLMLKKATIERERRVRMGIWTSS